MPPGFVLQLERTLRTEVPSVLRRIFYDDSFLERPSACAATREALSCVVADMLTRARICVGRAVCMQRWFR
jgi:hypothetical protein